MHAAGAAGAVVVLADCSQPAETVYYGAPCVGGSCSVVSSDAGSDSAWTDDGSSVVFYGSPPVAADSGAEAGDATASDASDAGDASAASDAATDGSNVDGSGDAGTD
jgi:hypothetical protein